MLCDICGENKEFMPDRTWYCHNCAVHLERCYNKYKGALPESMPYDTMIQLHHNIYRDCEKIEGVELPPYPTELLKGSEYKALVEDMQSKITKAWNSF